LLKRLHLPPAARFSQPKIGVGLLPPERLRDERPQLAAALAFRESTDCATFHPNQDQLALEIRWRPTVRRLCAPGSRAAGPSRIEGQPVRSADRQNPFGAV